MNQINIGLLSQRLTTGKNETVDSLHVPALTIDRVEVVGLSLKATVSSRWDWSGLPCLVQLLT